MSELSKNINNFFKFATKAEINSLIDELSLTKHLDNVLIMFYIEGKDINYISYKTGYSISKIKSDLKLIRKKISKLI